MEKIILSRWLFDEIIGDFIERDEGNAYEFLLQAQKDLEIRKIPQRGDNVDTVYVDFGGDLSSARDFAQMYGIDRKKIVLARDWRTLEGRRARLKPVNLDYNWSLINWNHEIHQQARTLIYRAEALYGTPEDRP